MDIERLLTSVGALSELLHVFYTSLLKQGFSEDQALVLCSEFMKSITKVN